MPDEIREFRIDVPDAVLEDLDDRLRRTRFPDQLEDDAGWDDGTDTAYLRELVGYWLDDYDWRAAEKLLNSFAQYKTEIDGIDLHFIHVRSGDATATPIILTHGWPGSVYEFHKVIEPLAKDFHVVVPSMPGYGFSSAPRRSGFDVKRVAEVEAALMARLGYERYGAQGGDWGAMVTGWLGLVDADHVAGLHLNMVPAGPPPRPTAAGVLSESETAALAEAGEFQNHETGYSKIQGTKPQTLGVALNDSPAGLAAWIVEKYRTWGDTGGDVESRFSKNDLLTTVVLYWVTQSATSSARLYRESVRSGRFGLIAERVDVPTGVSVYPGELYRAPRAWAEAWFDIRHWTEMPAGGHFPALEEPEAFAADVHAFFGGL